jgi:hypothetical protein
MCKDIASFFEDLRTVRRPFASALGLECGGKESGPQRATDSAEDLHLCVPQTTEKMLSHNDQQSASGSEEVGSSGLATAGCIGRRRAGKSPEELQNYIRGRHRRLDPSPL